MSTIQGIQDATTVEIRNKTQISWNFKFLKFKRPAQKIVLAIFMKLMAIQIHHQRGKPHKTLNFQILCATLLCLSTDNLLTYVLQDKCFTSPFRWITNELFHYACKLQNKKIHLKNVNSNCQSSFLFFKNFQKKKKVPLGNWQFSISLILMSIYCPQGPDAESIWPSISST